MIKEYGIKDWNSFIQTINGLTWSLARELGPSNIRVNAVAPGITKTDMVAALPEQVIAPLIKMIPHNILAAGIVLAANFVTGFSLLNCLEFFVFRKMKSSSTINHPLCGCESNVIQKKLPFRVQ